MDVNITTTTTTETVVANFFVSPTEIQGRLSQLANQWERWSPKFLRFEFVSAAPTSTPGLVSMWYDPDVRDETPTTIAASSTAVSDSVQGPAWSSMVLPISRLDRKTLFFTRDRGGDTDDLFEFAGQLYFSYAGPAVTGLYLGRLRMTYDFEFSKRCYEPTVTEVPDMTDATWLTGITLTKSINAVKLIAELYPTIKDLMKGSDLINDIGLKVRPGIRKSFRLLATLWDKYSSSAFSVTDAIRGYVRNRSGSRYGPVTLYPEFGAQIDSDVVSDSVIIQYTSDHGWTSTSTVADARPRIAYISFYNGTSEPMYLDFNYTALATTGDKAGTTGYCTSLLVRGFHIEEISTTELYHGCGMHPESFTSVVTVAEPFSVVMPARETAADTSNASPTRAATWFAK